MKTTTASRKSRPLMSAGVGVALVVCLAVGACEQPHREVAGHVVSTGRPIFYGQPDTSTAHMAVVALTSGPGTGFFCSGTLITPTVVLTAAHCLEGRSPTSIEIFFGNDVYSSGDYREVSEGAMHPDYSSQTVENDIAVIRLATAAPGGITPIPHLPSSLGLSSSDEGSNVDFSGFGLTESNTSGVKLHVEQSIGVVCNTSGGCSYGGGYVVDAGFGYTQSGGGPCSGDSGGPAFIFRSGQEYVAGVTSYGDQYCTQYGVSTTVDRFQGWIDSFIGAGEDCENGVDDDGDGQTDCDDSECSSHPACVGPDACEGAQTVGCGDQVAATTVGGPTAFAAYSCLSQSTEGGPERAFFVAVTDGTQVTADVNLGAGTGDLDLFLLPPDGTSCAPSACLDASLNSNNTPETLTFTAQSGGLYLVVDTWEGPGDFTLTISCAGGPEECDNGIDDDGDGQTDCGDSDCAGDPACTAPVPEECDNGIDDDGDGQTDCGDSDCVGDPTCQPGAEVCDNGIDDDGDGQTDCDDSDCDDHSLCGTKATAGMTYTGGCSCATTPAKQTPLPILLFLLMVLGGLVCRRFSRRRNRQALRAC